jgi:hypothetical protein
MKISDIPSGATSTIVLRMAQGHPSGHSASIGDEVTLRASRANGRVLLRVGTNAWFAEGAAPSDQDLLDQVIDTGLPRIAWVTRADQDGTIAIQVHRFARQAQWDNEIVIGVDETSLLSALRILPGRRTADQLEGWLTEQFLMAGPAGRGGPARMLASAGPQSVRLDRGFQLHGKRAIAHIENRDGQLWVKTLRYARRQHEVIALTLVHAQVSFRDATYTATLRERHQEDFARLLSTGQQYLNHWDEYSEREQRQVVARALSLGVAHYTRVQQTDSRTFRFHLDPGGGQKFLNRLGEEHTDLEASVRAPDGLRDGQLDLEDRSPEPAFAGSVAYVSEAAYTISLRVPEGDDVTPPPPAGDIYLSLAGDRVRIRRQRKARQRIETLSTPMPQLGLLLEGQPVAAPSVPKRVIQPRELAAFAPYQDFTEKQEEAVRIALNTPDIALIQGPPGTGKTSVITAIQECLVQLGQEAGNVGQSVLVTSFQHNAVEEVVRRTKVLGLPAVKIGPKQRAGGNRGVRDWCDQKAAELRGVLPPQGELLRAIRSAEALIVGYSRQPPQPTRTAELIGQIDQLAGRYLPAAIRARLASARADLTAASGPPRFLGDDLEPLRRSIAGIRVEEVTFADDGPHMARKAWLRLAARGDGDVAPEDLALLESAARFDGPGPPPFLEHLARLRDRLLDQTAPVTAPRQPAADDALADLFGEVMSALRDRLARSADGATAAVEEFLDVLEHDPDAVADAIRRYTAVIAATCQQASSQAMAESIEGHDILFDTVIVDEAARANPLDLMIPLCLATRRVILVGDHRQLPHLLEPDIERDLESSQEEQMLTALRQSMFERLFNYLRAARADDPGIGREITLDTQFRMHRVLGEFVSEAFYADDAKIAPGTRTGELHHGIPRYGNAVAVWADLNRDRNGPETNGRSKSRPAEATWIAEELERLSREAPEKTDFGVIAFYRAQVQAIWTALEAARLADRTASGQYQAIGPLADRLHVGTVDAFQGREFDVVLLSVTRSNNLPGGQPRHNRLKYGHLLLANRLCVAMSRQKRLLIAVGDADMFTLAATRGEVRGLVMFKRLCEDQRYGRVIRT